MSKSNTILDFCTGSSNNGWKMWKNKDGETLDAVYRKYIVPTSLT